MINYLDKTAPCNRIQQPPTSIDMDKVKELIMTEFQKMHDELRSSP